MERKITQRVMPVNPLGPANASHFCVNPGTALAPGRHVRVLTETRPD
jgi:hypothetical protein